MLNFAIIGFGGLGKVHFKNVKQITEKFGDVQLIAICDVDESKFTENTAINLGDSGDSLDVSAYRLYTDVNELLDNEKLDFVITALPTYLHEQMAVKIMERGIHVFSEKPMALNLEQTQNMIDVAKKNNVKLMIGQCLRFFPEYVVLKNIIDSKEYGNVIKAEFSRLSPVATWGWENWFMDEEKSGGAILDLHVHDVDFINYVFGRPKAVLSIATNYVSKHDSVTTSYIYDDKVVIATGDWGFPAKYPFTPVYRVRFEHATVEFAQKKLMLYTDAEAKEIEIPAGNGYADEVVEFINCIKENRESIINPPTASAETIEIALAEKKSADTATIVTL